MNTFYKIVSNAAFALNLLLLFFLFVEDQVVVPHWLQAVGRMHPLLLHLPIGLLLLLPALPLLRKSIGISALYPIELFVLALACSTAAITAGMGFLLSRESGYSGELIAQHKWAGIGVSWMTYGLFLWLKSREKVSRLFQFGVLASVVVLIIAGHLGGNITHGEGFILAPLQPEKAAITEETPVYEALIVPLLEQKCYSCHNQRKAKGGLVMTDPGRFRKGGDDGAAFVPGDTTQSLLLKRLHLPLNDEDHMPPDGKPQLNEGEIALLKDWIGSGGDLETSIKDLTDDHPLKALAQQVLAEANATQEKKYDFPPASEALVRELNIPFRTVTPLSNGSPALRAAIFVRETYEPRFLNELAKVKDQLVDLKLDHLPIKDEELSVIGQFPHLEQLNLDNTNISGKQLAALGNCKNLRSLALSGTPVDTTIAGLLRLLPALRELFVWDTGLDSTGISYLTTQFPSIDIQTGYVPIANELLQLSPPVVNQKTNLEGREEIRLEHNFPGAVIRFTIDGTEPDSSASEVYKEPLLLSRFAVIKARAFREKWLGSKVASTTFFPKSIPIKKAVLLTEPDPKYKGKGAAGLIDGEKGFANNFTSPFWVGYKDRTFEALFYPEDPATPVSSITLSYLQNMGSYLMPPTSVEAWGGPDAEHLQLIKRFKPEVPGAYLPNEIKGLDLAIPASTWACYKLVVRPIAALPAWHQGKGAKGWVFLDEVYFYSETATALVPAVHTPVSVAAEWG